MKDKKKEENLTLRKKHLEERENERRVSKKDNIIKMYQLLRESKKVETITLSCFKFYKKIGEGAFGEVYIVKKDHS